MPFLKVLVAGRKVVISVDRKDQPMALGRAVVHVILSCIELRAYVLAAVELSAFEESSDAEYYFILVEGVIEDFTLRRENIIGVSVDNTTVNPLFVRRLLCMPTI